MWFAAITTVNLRFSVKKKKSAVIRIHSLERSAGGWHAVVLQARAKCFVLQCIRVHYIGLQFNIKVQCYQNISQVLLTSAFILWPPYTCGFSIQEKIRCGLRFCSFQTPLTPPSVLLLYRGHTRQHFALFLFLQLILSFC